MGNSTPTPNCPTTNVSQVSIPSTNKYNAVNSFEITRQSIAKCNNNGDSKYTFNEGDFLLPSTFPSGLETLKQLINRVGSDNISIDYYAMANGFVSSHDCFATHSLYAHGVMSDTSCTNQVVLAQSNYNPNAGGPVGGEWMLLIKNIPLLLTTIMTVSRCTGSGCGCIFNNYGGWSNTTISVKVVVTVNLLSYCSQLGVDNLNSNLCYTYVSNYATSKDLGANQQMTDALKSYCGRKFAGRGLDILNPGSNISANDRKLCACNMPDTDYQEFLQSVKTKFPNLNLGSIRPNCLVPDCVTSPFKGNDLSGCPIPKCLNIVNFNDNDVEGNITITQNQECNDIVNGQGPNTAPTPTAEVKNFFSKYKWWFLAGLIALIAIIIIIVAIKKSRDNTAFSSETTTIETKTIE